MIPCPGCGAGMHFDIASQKLLCDYCGTTQEVRQAGNDRSAKADTSGEDTMDVTVFTCPQCGGEIYSTDNEASSFCSFCGASVMLEGRLARAARPLYIIPFKKTKEDCKQIYGDLTKRAWFSPKELKDPAYLERFRGIYLPFWVYSFEQKGEVKLKGTREDGKYLEHLSLTCDLDATYDGISYDASSAFNDELCRCITPFNRSSVEDFLPGYMSGFYADTADVPSRVYKTDAANDANLETIRKLEMEYGDDVHIEMPKDKSRKLHTKLKDVTMAMYPVWFLTYRQKDRVAYAVVNGETGKIAADLPVDRRKYLLGSLILALPIFLLLVLMPVITAKKMLAVASILALAAFVIFLLSSREIRRREERTDDKGYLSAAKGKSREDESAEPGDDGQTKIRPAGTGSGLNKLTSALRTILPVLGGIAGAIILAADPVSDVYYYSGALIVLACVCFTLMGLIGRFNLLTTRPIPEFFERKGGDDRA